MRGSPLLRALLAFGFILLLGLPLARMTRAPAGSTALAAVKAEPAREVSLALTFTALPKSVRVRHLGKEVWSVQPTEAEIEQTLTLPFPKEGVDLDFAADFPEDAPLIAMRVRLTDPDGHEYERTCWGKGTIEEVLTFP